MDVVAAVSQQRVQSMTLRRDTQSCQFKTMEFLTAENARSTKNVVARDCHSLFFAIFAIFVVNLPV